MDMPTANKLQTQRHHRFRNMLLFITFLLFNGVIFPSNLENFPWMLLLLITYTVWTMREYKECDPTRMILRTVKGYVVMCTLIALIQVWMQGQKSQSSSTTTSTFYAWMVHNRLTCSVLLYVLGYGVSMAGDWMWKKGYRISLMVWAIVEICYICYVAFVMDFGGKSLFLIMENNMWTLLAESITNPTVFTHFAWHILCTYNIMAVVQYTCSSPWGVYLYLGSVLLSFLVAYVTNFGSLINTVLGGLLARPCKVLMEKSFSPQGLLFVCLCIQCFFCIDFIMQYSGLMKHLTPGDSLFFNVVQSPSLVPVNVTSESSHNHTNTTTTTNTSGGEEASTMFSYMPQFSRLGSVAWYTFTVLSGAEAMPSFKVWKWNIWQEFWGMFRFFCKWTTITQMYMDLVVHGSHFAINFVLSSISNVQLIFGVLSPVSLIILIERMDDLYQELCIVADFDKEKKDH